MVGEISRGLAGWGAERNYGCCVSNATLPAKGVRVSLLIIVLYGLASAKCLGDSFIPLYSSVCFLQGICSAKNVTAQIFLRLHIYEFLSDFFKNCNIDNRHYEIYIGR